MFCSGGLCSGGGHGGNDVSRQADRVGRATLARSYDSSGHATFGERTSSSGVTSVQEAQDY